MNPLKQAIKDKHQADLILPDKPLKGKPRMTTEDLCNQLEHLNPMLTRLRKEFNLDVNQ